jgi:hypothetical protein
MIPHGEVHVASILVQVLGDLATRRARPYDQHSTVWELPGIAVAAECTWNMFGGMAAARFGTAGF